MGFHAAVQQPQEEPMDENKKPQGQGEEPTLEQVDFLILLMEQIGR